MTTNGFGKVAAPQREVTDLAYDNDCKAALSPVFDQLIEQVVAAGWDRRKAAYALMFLASRNVTGTAKQEEA